VLILTDVAPTDIEWEKLSDRGRWILQQVALPVALGLSYNEVARRLGCSRPVVGRWLDELAEEIRNQVCS
jgi:DNA-directed RNA polymerase specialized sigma24 family protein